MFTSTPRLRFVTDPSVEPAVGVVPLVADVVGEPVATAPVPAAAPAGFVAPATQAELDALVATATAAATAPFANFAALQAAADGAVVTAARVTELEGALTAARTTAALREAALAGHAVNVDQVLQLLPKDAATVNADGSVVGAGEAVGAFLAANPHLVARAGTPALAPLPGAGKTADQAGSIMAISEMQAVTSAQLAADPELKARFAASNRHWTSQGKS